MLKLLETVDIDNELHNDDFLEKLLNSLESRIALYNREKGVCINETACLNLRLAINAIRDRHVGPPRNFVGAMVTFPRAVITRYRSLSRNNTAREKRCITQRRESAGIKLAVTK